MSISILKILYGNYFGVRKFFVLRLFSSYPLIYYMVKCYPVQSPTKREEIRRDKLCL